MTIRDEPDEEPEVAEGVNISFIGDFHYVLGAKKFRYRLGTADVIFLEYPDEKIHNDKSKIQKIWNGMKNAYTSGGIWRLLIHPIISVERILFARSTVIWELGHKDKYRDKLVGIESADARETYFEGGGRTSFTKALKMVLLLTVVPRFMLKMIMEQGMINDGEKSEDGKIYAHEMAEFTHSADSSEQKTKGREEREEVMADSIAEYLQEHPDVDDVVVVVGAGHLEPVIKLVHERVPTANISIANSNMVSEYLESLE